MPCYGLAPSLFKVYSSTKAEMLGTFHHEAEAVCSQQHLHKCSLCDKARCQEERSSLCGHHPGPKGAGKLRKTLMI